MALNQHGWPQLPKFDLSRKVASLISSSSVKVGASSSVQLHSTYKEHMEKYCHSLVWTCSVISSLRFYPSFEVYVT